MTKLIVAFPNFANAPKNQLVIAVREINSYLYSESYETIAYMV